MRSALAHGAGWRLSRRFEYRGALIAWDVFGSGDPVVLLHGFPGRSYTWRYVAPMLAQSRRVFVVDMLGFGQSSKGDGQGVSQRAQAELTAALLDHWDLAAPDIVAHDIGAAYALGAVLFFDRRPRRLVLIDAATLNPCISSNSMHVRQHIQAYMQLPASLHATIMRAHIPTTMSTPMSEEVFIGYFAPWSGPAGQAAYYSFLEQIDESYNDEIEANLHRVDAPTLIIWGTEDRWIPISHARRLRALIAGSELVTIPGAGHFVADDAPAALTSAISSFLDRDAERA